MRYLHLEFAVFSIAPVLGTRIVPMRVRARDCYRSGYCRDSSGGSNERGACGVYGCGARGCDGTGDRFGHRFCASACVCRDRVGGSSYLVTNGAWIRGTYRPSRWCIRTYAQPVLRDAEHLNVSCAQRASHAHRTACAELYLAADWR